MNYVCENYEINKEKTEDRSAALAAYAGKIVLGTKDEIYRADQEQQRQAELNAEQARTHATGR